MVTTISDLTGQYGCVVGQRLQEEDALPRRGQRLCGQDRPAIHKRLQRIQ